VIGCLTACPMPQGGLYLRFFAWIYDRALKRAEAGGLRELRRTVLSKAVGRTLEIGAGTGLNLPHYPDAVTELTLTEPSAPMASMLRRKLAGHATIAVLVETAAEAMPFQADSFDTIVTTLVLCTVADPIGVLRELARVLRPGGGLIFLEHVRANDPPLAGWQDRLAKVWSWLADGCQCNRDTLATINCSPLVLESVEHVRLPMLGILVSPGIYGVARKPSALSPAKPHAAPRPTRVRE